MRYFKGAILSVAGYYLIIHTFLVLFAWAGTPRPQQQVQPVAGVLTLNLVPGTSSFKVILSANVTSVVIQNPTPGTIISVIFTENATGGFTVAFGGNIANPCTVLTVANATTTCQFQYDSTSNTWNGIGGSGGVPGQFSVKTFGAVGDAKKTFTASGSTGNATITDATNTPWLASDVGKKMYCTGSGGANALTVQFATIATFNSAGSISISPATANNNILVNSTQCVWFTQKDTAAFTAATAAALLSTHNNFSSTNGPYNGTVYCPPGGYVVDGVFFQQNSGSAGFGANFVGSGIGSCNIFVSPDVTIANNGWMMVVNAMTDFTISDFTVDCSNAALSVAGQAFRIVNALRWQMNRVYLKGCTTSGDGGGAMIFVSGGNGLVSDHISVDGNSNPVTSEVSLMFANGATGVHMRAFNSTNPGAEPLLIQNSCGPGVNGSRRNTNGSSCLFEASTFDEGATGANINLIGSTANFSGITAFAGNTGIVSLDATSSAWMDKSTLVPFGAACAGGNIPGIVLAAGAYFYSTGNIISSCGTAGAVNGTSTSQFIDNGGNTLQNCVAGTCSAVTAATYTTLGFTGGIVPKATVTHTPNTCYAASGTLVQSQNLCNFLNDQNYQVINITAQSGGAAPAASSCTVAPVVTFSDGTRTATLTLTTGKTSWSSAVDASAVNSVFASGTTLTVSVGTFTCATPPANLAVSYVLQSVLNQ